MRISGRKDLLPTHNNIIAIIFGCSARHHIFMTEFDVRFKFIVSI